MGAVLCVLMPRLFMEAYPDALAQNLVAHPDKERAHWSSAMTFKIVGVLSGLNNPQAWKTKAMLLGVAIGLVTESLRKLLKANESWKRFGESSTRGRATEFVVDAVLLPSPYASSFGGFVGLATSTWFAIGGAASTFLQWKQSQEPAAVSEGGELIPEDMSTTSLVGGGLIAGESLGALALAVLALSAIWFK